MSKSINEVAQEAHTNAIEKGWWDAPRSFGELITLCHSELSEQNELLKKVAESYVRIINDLEEDCERYFDQRNRLIAIEAATEGLTGIEAVCTGNVIKYVWRWKRKNGVEDLKKARWYLEKLIEGLEGGEQG